MASPRQNTGRKLKPFAVIETNRERLFNINYAAAAMESA